MCREGKGAEGEFTGGSYIGATAGAKVEAATSRRRRACGVHGRFKDIR